MPPSEIPLILLSIVYVVSKNMTLMASGSAPFQCFPFRSGHIPHSNPTLGSLPFSTQGKSYKPFQGWTNPTIS